MENKVIDPVIREAINTYGKEKQFHQCVEELGELIVAISHYLRNRPNAKEEVAEELADAKLMIRQVELMMDMEKEVDMYISAKLRRLAYKLNLDN
jgi:NTP pyrophosphatase (non-canonical NTP hydrolase)